MPKGRDVQALILSGQVKKLIAQVEGFMVEFADAEALNREVGFRFFKQLIEANKVLLTRWES